MIKVISSGYGFFVDPAEISGFVYFLMPKEKNGGVEATNYFIIFLKNSNKKIEHAGLHEEIKPLVEKIIELLNGVIQKGDK